MCDFRSFLASKNLTALILLEDAEVKDAVEANDNNEREPSEDESSEESEGPEGEETMDNEFVELDHSLGYDCTRRYKQNNWTKCLKNQPCDVIKMSDYPSLF